MSEMAVNTVQFRFPAGSPRPSWVEIAAFLKTLDTDLLHIETTYKTAEDRSLFIKFTSEEAMVESLKKNMQPRQFVYGSGKKIEVRMTIAGANMRYVRVFDLPPELDDAKLSKVLGDYGKIEYTVREKFPANLGLDHMYTGVRGVYMDVKTSIPSTIVVAGRKGNIFYEGLRDTCFHCQGMGHRRESCPQRKTRQEKKHSEALGSPSYAGIVSGLATASTERTTSESEVVEVLEEDEDYEDLPTEILEEEVVQPVGIETSSDAEKEKRRKEGLKTLEEVAIAIQEAMKNPQANQRRAQYAASGSSSGTSPKKKIARTSRY